MRNNACQEIYLDNAATTKVRREVLEVVLQVMEEVYGNPSSLHKKGLEAERVLKQAREKVAAALDVNPDSIIFTSGGTEANNLAIKGVAWSRRKAGRHVITTAIEHPSVLDCFKFLEHEGFEVSCLPVNQEGIVSVDNLQRALRPDTILVSVMAVNNEVGSIQPISEIGSILESYHSVAKVKPVFHVDAVQALGKVEINPRSSKVDLMTLSAHKVHGPKGVGALYVNKDVRLLPLLNGGGQENGLRSGTENVPAIAGFGVAVEMAVSRFDVVTTKLRGLRKRFLEALSAEIPWFELNGPRGARAAPHIINASFPGYKAEVLLNSLDARGICVSIGAACSSKKGARSHVLTALGLNDTRIDSAVRFSFSEFNTEEEVDFVVRALADIVKELAFLRQR